MKYHSKAFSTFHQINAFEEDGFLMLDLCCSDDGQAINNYLIQNLRKSGEALDKVIITSDTHACKLTHAVTEVKIYPQNMLRIIVWHVYCCFLQDKRHSVEEEEFIKCTHTASVPLRCTATCVGLSLGASFCPFM